MMLQAITNAIKNPSADAHQGFIELPQLGSLFLCWSKKGLRELRIFRQAEAASLSKSETVPSYYKKPLLDYFAGDPVDPALLPVDLIGTPFQVEVWKALGQIRRGSVRSYAGIARDLGNPRAMRAVGRAVGANPILLAVPCHRVVREDFALGGFSAGLDLKRKLLKLEGIAVHNEHVYPGQLSLQA